MSRTVFILGKRDRYANYLRAAETAGMRVYFSDTPEPAVECDALLLPGGGDLEPWRYGQENTASTGLEPERDAAELTLLEQFASANKPVLGICRGLQVINVFFGGTLVQDLPGHGALEDGDRFHPAYTEPSFLSGVCGEYAIVNSAHHQAIKHLGRELRAVQWSPDGVIEAAFHRTLPIWGIQWHPERLPPGGLGERLFALFAERCH